MTLPAFVAGRRTAVRPAAAAVDRYFLPAGPTAANLPQPRAATE